MLKLAKDIVSGFIEMAERHFLHRDLKLANIFMNSGRALLADFGFAKKHKYCSCHLAIYSRRKSIMWAVRSTCRLKLLSAIFTQLKTISGRLG